MTDQQWHDEALRLTPILEGAANSDKEPRRLYLYEVEALRRAAAHLRTRPSETTERDDPITDDEQAALYRHCQGTPHYEVVRRLYRIASSEPALADSPAGVEFTAPLPVAQGEQGEREALEAWHRDEFPNDPMQFDPLYGYERPQVRNRFKGWQAARATAPTAALPVAQCRADGRCQYAIDHGAEDLGHCPPGRCAMPVAQGGREAFEAWAVRNLYSVAKVPNAVDLDGQPVYEDTRTHCGWWAWQAARATAPSDRAAYEGCREDLLDWKRRALKAEASLRESEKTCDNLNRALASEVNGQTFMGEPVATAPKLRELSDGEIDRSALVALCYDGEGTQEVNATDLRSFARAVLAAAGKEKP